MLFGCDTKAALARIQAKTLLKSLVSAAAARAWRAATLLRRRAAAS